MAYIIEKTLDNGKLRYWTGKGWVANPGNWEHGEPKGYVTLNNATKAQGRLIRKDIIILPYQPTKIINTITGEEYDGCRESFEVNLKRNKDESLKGKKGKAVMKGWQLKQRQGLPLEIKERFSEVRIREWYEHWEGQVYISFSGGEGSTVLVDIVRKIYPDVPAVFVDTGLEYPEIKEFVKTIDNVITLRPKMPFYEVIEKYGYPVVSKEQSCAISRYRNTKDPIQKYRRLNGWPKGKKGMISKKWQYLIEAPFKISDACCDVMKKNPLDLYAKETGRKSISGMMAEESRGRKMQYLKQGCNAFENEKPTSQPIAFWLKEDLRAYIKKYNLPYSKIYDMGESRTGCMFCMFGVHLEKGENRFQRMAKTHPKQYDYCIDSLGIGKVLNFMEIRYEK